MPFDEAEMPPEPGTGLMPRATIHQLVAAKVHAKAAYLRAWDAMKDAHALERSAAPSGKTGEFPWIGAGSRYGNHTTVFESREKYEEHITRALEQNVWDHVIATTKLDQLMDRTEREAFRTALKDNPPEATVENIAATIERLIGESGTIFRRGIAIAFSKLDRRFRSHDGFKIGSRVVLSYAYSGYGWTRGMDDTLVDIERTFCTLDGKPQPERYAGVIGAVSTASGRGISPKAFEVITEYFKICVYKNNNVHLWFRRKDLVAKVNQLLAEYYGENLGAGPDSADVKHAYASTPATSGPGGFGLFPSPEAVVREVVHKAGLRKRSEVAFRNEEELARCYPPRRVLEPSAGTGAIASWASECIGASVTCVEIQGHLAAALGASGRYAKVVNDDFLERKPADLGTFDVIVMNPPFDGCRDIDHVTHALQFLAPGGVLVSVMGAGVEFREDRKTADFRAMVEHRKGRFYDLPPGSFAESGTNMNTVLCCIREGREFHA